MANPTNAKDALILELLGDVGHLHDAVKDLRGALDGTVAELHKASGEAAGALSQAADAAISRTAAAAATEEARRVQAARVEAAGLRSEFMLEANQALAELRKAQLGLRGRTLALVCVIAAVCSLAGAAVGYSLARSGGVIEAAGGLLGG